MDAPHVTGRDKRTYWHLGEAGRRPTEYEIATSRLLYYPGRGLEVDVPQAAWNARHRGESVTIRDGNRFADPRETTYTKYTELQSKNQMFVEGLFASVERSRDAELPAEWLTVLERVMGPMRYPVHALQMVAAYVGHMAPEGRIVVTCLFQTADEIRRVQLLAYRMRQLQESHPGFGERSRLTWENDREWQPMRELLERLLVTYDWGEALVALNLVVKPAFDELLTIRLGNAADESGDGVLAKLLFSLRDDQAWQRDWTRAFLTAAIDDEPANDALVRRWVEKWTPACERAVGALAPLLGGGSG